MGQKAREASLGLTSLGIPHQEVQVSVIYGNLLMLVSYGVLFVVEAMAQSLNVHHKFFRGLAERTLADQQPTLLTQSAMIGNYYID